MSGGIDLTGANAEVVLVIRSVLPVVTHETERPERIGTCVLLRIDGHAVIATAAHVIDEAQRATGRFTVAVGGQLITIHRDRFVTPPHHPADIGLIAMRSEAAKIICESGSVFLDADMIDEAEKADGDDHLLLDFSPDEIVLDGRRVNPPMVQGMSGGGVFRFSRRRPETTKLVGILIEHHKTARVMAGTRVAVVAALAREVIARHWDAFR